MRWLAIAALSLVAPLGVASSAAPQSASSSAWLTFSTDGVRIQHPPNWHATVPPLTPVASPRQLMAVASFRSPLTHVPTVADRRERSRERSPRRGHLRHRLRHAQPEPERMAGSPDSIQARSVRELRVLRSQLPDPFPRGGTALPDLRLVRPTSDTGEAFDGASRPRHLYSEAALIYQLMNRHWVAVALGVVTLLSAASVGAASDRSSSPPPLTRDVPRFVRSICASGRSSSPIRLVCPPLVPLTKYRPQPGLQRRAPRQHEHPAAQATGRSHLPPRLQRGRQRPGVLALGGRHGNP